MSLSAFLNMLNDEFLPELPKLRPHLPGWVPKLECKLGEVQPWLKSGRNAAAGDALAGELCELFKERREELGGFIKNYRARLESSERAKAPNSVAAFVPPDGIINDLPENETLTENLRNVIDALGKERTRPDDASPESAAIGGEQQ